MTHDYSQAASDLIARLKTSSRKSGKPQPPAPASFTAEHMHVVINRAEHCTFILGGTALPKHKADPNEQPNSLGGLPRDGA